MHTSTIEEELSDAPAVNPIVLVPGFLGPAKDDESFDAKSMLFSYWGEAATLGTSNNPVLCVWPSGFSSLHDRACEIFYQIKGGTVDYGEEHSKLYAEIVSFFESDRQVHNSFRADVVMIDLDGHIRDYFQV